MDNPISNNNIEVNNSISNLSFLWEANFNDGTKISQLDENGIEHRYQEVKDRFNDLQFFYLYNKNNLNDRFIIDFKKGLIFRNKIKEYPNSIIEEKKNIRLIYLRTRRKEIRMIDSKEQSEKIWYLFGIQWNDNLGFNRQWVLKIDNEGNWVLGE